MTELRVMPMQVRKAKLKKYTKCVVCGKEILLKGNAKYCLDHKPI